MLELNSAPVSESLDINSDDLTVSIDISEIDRNKKSFDKNTLQSLDLLAAVDPLLQSKMGTVTEQIDIIKSEIKTKFQSKRSVNPYNPDF
jgi:hypothetical protein